jgi:hypothetical protein
MKKVVAALLIAVFSLSVFACVTRDPGRLDRARNANNNAQRDMNQK